MSDTDLSRVDAFLANLSSKQQQQPQPQRGNLIFALDATGSREQAHGTARPSCKSRCSRRPLCSAGSTCNWFIIEVRRALTPSVKHQAGSAIRCDWRL